MPLQFDAGERVARIVAFGIDADDNAAIGVEFLARILAHAVGGDAALFGCGGDDPPARTHAEAVDRAVVAAMMRQAVGGSAQVRMARARAEARLVDPALRMFDPYPDGKGLRL